MVHGELMSALDLLRQSRQELISRTTSQSVDFFSNLFLFEKNEVGLKLSFEKEKTQFINSHFLALDVDTTLLVDSNFYLSAIKKLIFLLSEEKTSMHVRTSSSAFYKDLTLTKVKFLDLLLKIEEKSSVNLSELKYAIIKDNRLFEREMEKLETVSKGN